MRHRFYTTGGSAMSAMLASIARAQKSVFLEMYIFDQDDVGETFLRTLKERSRSGVKVILILDALGSSTLGQGEITQLKEAGIEVRFFSYWLKRTHRKLLIIDEEVVFLGGVNISGKFSFWNDLQVKLSGKHFSNSALRSFARMYRICGGTDEKLLHVEPKRLLKRARMWFREHGMGPTHRSLRKDYEHRINEARNEITLITPYLFPRRWLLAHLHEAVLRGVKVTIIVPQRSDQWIADEATQFVLEHMRAVGIETLMSTTMNHAKVMIIDEKNGIIGSHNLALLSFEWNVEASVFFDDPRMVHQLSVIVQRWKKLTFSFHPTTHATHHVFAPIIRAIMRIMWFFL